MLKDKPKFLYQWLLVLVLAFLCDIVAAVHIKTLIANNIALAIGTIILIDYLNFLSNLWFVTAPDIKRRLAITTAGALGAGAGTGVVILYF